MTTPSDPPIVAWFRLSNKLIHNKEDKYYGNKHICKSQRDRN